MALQLCALREALIEAGTSPEKAGRAAEELAGYDREFIQLRAEIREGFFRIETLIGSVRTGASSEAAELRSEIKLLKWITGAIFAAIVPLLVHMVIR